MRFQKSILSFKSTGNQLFKEGKYLDAIEYYSKAIDLLQDCYHVKTRAWFISQQKEELQLFTLFRFVEFI
jgi:tetratricopeptide (TPR) repeat protein